MADKDNLIQRGLLRPLPKEVLTEAEMNAGTACSDLLSDARKLGEPLVSQAASAIEACARLEAEYRDSVHAEWAPEKMSARRISLAEMQARNGANGAAVHQGTVPNMKDFAGQRIMAIHAKLLTEDKIDQASKLAATAATKIEAIRKEIQKEKSTLFSLANPALDHVAGPSWDAKIEMLVHQGPSAVRILFDEMRQAAEENGYTPGEDSNELANLYFVCHRAEEICNRWAVEVYKPAVLNARTSTEKTRLQSEREQVMPRLLYDIAEYRREAAASGTENLFEGYKLCVQAYGKKLYVDSKPPRMNAKAVLGPDSPEFMRRQRRAKKIQIPVNVAPRGKAPVGEIRGDDSRFERLLGRRVVVRLAPRNDLDRGAEMRGQLVHVDDDEVVLRQTQRRREEVRVSGKTPALTGALRCKTERIDLRIDRKKILSARVALEDVEAPPIQP